MTSPDATASHPAGTPVIPPATRDPFEALDELMVVIEALCPVWPPRPTHQGQGPYVL